MSQLRFRSTPIIIGNFESCFKQRDESTVNAAVSNHPRNMSLSTESPAKWAFAGFGEGVLTVAIESEAKGHLDIALVVSMHLGSEQSSTSTQTACCC